jgi:rSAM/selenodomain-associated transferase 1
MPRNTLVIFSKAPRLGAVKTRLARDVGAVAAWRFFRRTSRRIVHRLVRDRRWRCVLAVTPDRFRNPPTFWRGVELRGQGSGDLGRRMERALRAFGNRPVIVVGCDIPDLTAAHVAAAFRALRSLDVVFGPASDGGYWLVGTRHPRFARGLFDDVRWSTEHAFADTLANTKGKRVAFVATLDDVDTGADLPG